MAEIIPILIVIICVILGVAGIHQISKSGRRRPMLCPNCGTQGNPQSITKGSILIEIILWICFIVPGLIYSVWRLASRHKACPACGMPNMIPIDSPRARQILSQ